jgi:hypothetical protein
VAKPGGFQHFSWTGLLQNLFLTRPNHLTAVVLAGRHFRHETAAFAVRSDGRMGNVANYTETSIRVGDFATMACETFMNVGHHSFCSLKELCIGKAGHHSTSVSCLPHSDRITEPLDYEKRILWLTGARRQRGEILPFVRTGACGYSTI